MGGRNAAGEQGRKAGLRLDQNLGLMTFLATWVCEIEWCRELERICITELFDEYNATNLGLDGRVSASTLKKTFSHPWKEIFRNFFQKYFHFKGQQARKFWHNTPSIAYKHQLRGGLMKVSWSLEEKWLWILKKYCWLLLSFTFHMQVVWATVVE